VADGGPRVRRGWRVLLADVGLIAVLGLVLTLVDNYHARKAELLELRSGCEDRLIDLVEEVSKRARIVQLDRDGRPVDDQKADSDISSTGSWNRVLHGCLNTDLFEPDDDLWVAFPEARKRSDEAFAQPADVALTQLTDANHWALFALDQVRQADLTGWVLAVDLDAPGVAFHIGDRTSG
jgi:hypothetical protein